MAQDNAIRLGIVGLGRAFTLMLPTFVQDDRVRLVAATDPREAARAMFRRDFNATAYPTLEQLCDNPEVELLYIASPHQFHARHIAIAAQAGKHVLVEKPLAITLEECTEIVNTVEASSISLIVGHSHSFDGPVLHAARLLQSDRYGPVGMINALNYTDFLYRPRRPEELDSRQGGGVVFSQAAHQIDIIRLLGGGMIDSVRAHTGNWDPQRSTEGAYGALLTFRDGAFATATYSGYAHYDSDELMGGIGEMGLEKDPAQYGAARARLSRIGSARDEAELKAASNYGGALYQAGIPRPAGYHQHFGHIVVSAARADIRLTPGGLMIYGDQETIFQPTPKSAVPRAEVVDELWASLRQDRKPLHDARWARATTEACLAILASARSKKEVELRFQVPAGRL